MHNAHAIIDIGQKCPDGLLTGILDQSRIRIRNGRIRMFGQKCTRFATPPALQEAWALAL
jgi:hypothetical protein